MKRIEEIERSAEEIVQAFIEAERGLPQLEETYYSHRVYNVTRADGEPSPRQEREDFRKRFISIMPASDEKGNLRVEVARWAER